MLNDMPKFDEEADDDCEAFYFDREFIRDMDREIEDSELAPELWADIFADEEEIMADEYHGKYCMCIDCGEFNRDEMELDFPGLSRYYDDSDTDEHRRESDY